jgi:hypothetical protein
MFQRVCQDFRLVRLVVVIGRAGFFAFLPQTAGGNYLLLLTGSWGVNFLNSYKTAAYRAEIFK